MKRPFCAELSWGKNSTSGQRVLAVLHWEDRLHRFTFARCNNFFKLFRMLLRRPGVANISRNTPG